MANETELEETEKSGITEVTEMGVRRLDGVRGAANGASFLAMKAKQPMGDQGEDTDDDLTADAQEREGSREKDDDDDDDTSSMKGAFCGDETCGVCLFRFGDAEKAKLSTGQRKKLPKSAFAIPEKAPGPGSYPIHDKAHARNALSRVSSNGTPEEKKRVRAAVARRFPGIGKPKQARKAGHTESMGQTEAMHPSERTGPRRMDTQRPEGRPERPDAGDINSEHDGGGDTAPEKDLHRDEAESQTRANARKSESPGAERPTAMGERDLGGDRAGSGDDAAARSESGSQTREMERHSAGGGISAESQRAMNYARTGAFKQSLTDVIAALERGDLSEAGIERAQKQVRRLLRGLALDRRLPHPTQEIESMTNEELNALLDEREARKAAEKKAARKARKEKLEKKAAKKAAKTHQADGQGSEEAAQAVKSAPAVDVDAISAGVAEAVKAQLAPLAERVKIVEDQPARARPALNELAGNAVQRGQMTEGEAQKALADLDEAMKAEQDPQKKAAMGAKITELKLSIQARKQFGNVGAPR